jgi:hypothetical protein
MIGPTEVGAAWLTENLVQVIVRRRRRGASADGDGTCSTTSYFHYRSDGLPART